VSKPKEITLHTLNEHTLNELVDRYGVELLEHLDRQVAIPVTNAPQIQGDVSILPITDQPPAGAAPAGMELVGSAGVAVVRGENGGNTHSLHGDGPIYYGAADTRSKLDLGVLLVPDGSTAWLAHPEHGYMGIAPGTYRIGRQREQAGQTRLVAD
jgi:hypothetical protein